MPEYNKTGIQSEKIDQIIMTGVIFAQTTFPNIPLELNLRYPDTLRTDWYSAEEIYTNVFKMAGRFEIGGAFDLLRGFQIQPQISFFDQKTNRPYVVADANSYTGIVFHTHPPAFLATENNSYPSREDTLFLVQYHDLISLILTVDGIFIMGSLTNKVSRVHHARLWAEADKKGDEMEVVKFFQKDEALQPTVLNNTHLFIRFVPLQYAYDQAVLRQQVEEIYRLRKQNNEVKI